MEQQVLDLLKATQSSSAQPRTAAELELKKLYGNEAFPAALVTIGSHNDINTSDRVAALLSLKSFVNLAWSPSLEDYAGSILIGDQAKADVRQRLISLVYDAYGDSKVTNATANIISIIAKSDFPEEWPGLLESLLSQINQSNDEQLHAILIVLGELLDGGLDEDQFYRYASIIVNALHHVSVDGGRKLMVRAHAVHTFRTCFDFVENLKDKDESNIKTFAKGVCDTWAPFFLNVVKEPMPTFPSVDEEERQDSDIGRHWRGVIALKVQVVMAIFPDLIAADEFFNACWSSIQAHGEPYHASYVDGERQNQLVNQYQLQYTFDFLVVEELDYLQALLEAPQVKQQLDQMLATDVASHGNMVITWISSVLDTLVTFSSITKEAEEMWNFDFNVFLSEETFAEANNTPRSVCASFIWKICNWFPKQTLESLLGYVKLVFEGTHSTWRHKEAALFTLQQVAEEYKNEDRVADPNAVRLCGDYARPTMADAHEFLRARGHIAMAAVAVAWMADSGPVNDNLVFEFAEQSLNAMDNDDSNIVKTACIRTMKDYLATLPSPKSTDLQSRIINSIAKFLSGQDLEDMNENVDLIDVVLLTLRDTIMANPLTCLEHNALDVLITMVKYGAARDDHSSILIDEAFECVAEAMSKQGVDAYSRLCAKIMPSLMAALDVEDPATKEKTALTDVSVSTVKILAEYAPQRLPTGFVGTAMPRLCRIIFSDNDFYVKQLSTLAIKHMLMNDKDQVFGWTDPQTQKTGLEMCFLVIGHLLGPGVDEISAAEVGELAVSVVDQAGAAALGTSMHELLRVLAERLSTAEHLSLIQSLTSVFARLSLLSATDVLDFLSSLPIGQDTALTIVITKWLENSTGFVGFDAIRQNSSALVAIYKTHDPRVSAIECNGDLIPDTSSRIKTRSMAKNQPIRYTRISAPLKLIKVLVAELLPYGDPNAAFTKPIKSPALSGPRAASSGGSWESDDEGSVLGGFGSRGADDATQKSLVEFFKAEGTDSRFQTLYAQLNEDERKRCVDAVQGWERLEGQRVMMGAPPA